MGEERKYLTQTEVEKMIRAIPKGPFQLRNRALILITYIHALRSQEAVTLKWSALDLDNGTVFVRRCKNSTSTSHYLTSREIRLLKRLRSAQQPGAYVFQSRQGGPITTRTMRDIVAQAGEQANIGITAHPHMLRHGAGFFLANSGKDTRSLQDYMGHKQIRHTILYTQIAPRRFRDFWPG
jgi:integrase